MDEVEIEPKRRSEPDKSRRRRLLPEVRQNLILDVAGDIVVAEGVSAVSMELVGREAGVSKALVYSYFPNRIDLLSALLTREYRVIDEKGAVAARKAKGVDALLRAITRVYLEHVRERGLIISLLMNDPQISSQMKDVSVEGRATAKSYLGHVIRREFDIRDVDLDASVDLLMGITGLAGDYLSRTGADYDLVEDIAVEIILGGLERLARRQEPDANGQL